jgi:hypothetical protein
MGKFWLGAGLLALFLALGLWVSSVMDTVHMDISQDLSEAAELTLAGDMEQGYFLAQQAQAQWEKKWHGSACVADHAPMDEIDGLFAQLPVYRQAEQPGDFAACCTRLSMLVAAMSEVHSLTWWNLL